MSFQTQLILGLAVVDAAIVAVLYRKLRTSRRMDEKALTANGAGLLAFVAQALFCFEGMFLVLQLAVIAACYALCYLQYMGKLSQAKAVASKEQP